MSAARRRRMRGETGPDADLCPKDDPVPGVLDNEEPLAERVPPGVYEVEIEHAQHLTSRAGNPTVLLLLRVVDARDEDAREAIGAEIETFVTFTREGRFRFSKFAKAAGVMLPKNVEPSELKRWAKGIVGNQCAVLVRHRWSRWDEPLVEIARYLPPEES